MLRLQTKPAVEVIVAEVGDLLLFEGDVAVPHAALVEEGIAIHDPAFRWPQATIPFEIESGNASDIQSAIAHWQNNTPIRFRAHTTEPDFVVFRDSSSGSDSPVGRQRDRQFVNVKTGAVVGEIIHEIGHTVGLWHEHSRHDRDKFIEVMFDNIKPSAEINFQQHITDGDDLGPYDFDSIMHYPPFAFAIDRTQPTLRGRKGETFGQRLRLSAGDIGAVQTMYP